jgi:hypothetical protein
MEHSCIPEDALHLIAGSSGMLGDGTQERRGKLESDAEV